MASLSPHNISFIPGQCGSQALPLSQFGLKPARIGEGEVVGMVFLFGAAPAEGRRGRGKGELAFFVPDLGDILATDKIVFEVSLGAVKSFIKRLFTPIVHFGL